MKPIDVFVNRHGYLYIRIFGLFLRFNGLQTSIHPHGWTEISTTTHIFILHIDTKYFDWEDYDTKYFDWED